jgi:hypothetical protein
MISSRASCSCAHKRFLQKKNSKTIILNKIRRSMKEKGSRRVLILSQMSQMLTVSTPENCMPFKSHGFIVGRIACHCNNSINYEVLVSLLRS